MRTVCLQKSSMLDSNAFINIGLSLNSLRRAQYLRTDEKVLMCKGNLPSSDLTAKLHVFECTPSTTFIKLMCRSSKIFFKSNRNSLFSHNICLFLKR